MQIKGAIALVTGGAKGIGFAFSLALLEHGAKAVRLLDICKDDGQKAQKQLEEKYGGGCATFDECNVTDNEDLTRAMKQVVADHGKLDILCNNAGVVDEDNWEKTIAINLNAVIFGTYLGMEMMNSGIIVNTASLGGVAPMSFTPVYCASKHGVVGFTRSIAPVAMKKKSIRVNCLCPAFVETPMLDRQKMQPHLAAVINHIGVVTPEFVTKGLIDVITDDSKNGETIMMKAPETMVYIKFPFPGI